MYLHEIIIEAVEILIHEGEPFSAWDVTQWVRDCLLDYLPGDISDCPSFTDKEGDERYNVEHSRVKNLVHLYLRNYNPNRIQQAHGPKFITYTPVVLQDSFAPATSTVFDPIGWRTNPRQVLDGKLVGGSDTSMKVTLNPPARTTTYVDVGANKDKLTDAQLIEAAKKILKHFNGT